MRMEKRVEFLRNIAQGPIWREMESRGSAAILRARLGDFGASLIAKGKVGRHFRAISRNGLVLWMSALPMSECCDAMLRLRISIWHRASLPGERPSPWGLLVYVEPCPSAAPDSVSPPESVYDGTFESCAAPHAALSIELCNRRFLNFGDAVAIIPREGDRLRDVAMPGGVESKGSKRSCRQSKAAQPLRTRLRRKRKHPR